MARTTVPPTPQLWRNRIVGTAAVDPATLAPHPLNWRRHPDTQKAALRGVLREVGLVQDVLVSQQTGRLLDGHLRVALALEEAQPTIPVTYVDLSDDEERLILATLDPLAALAETDAAALQALLAAVTSGEAGVQALLQTLAQENGPGVEEPTGPLDDVDPPMDQAEELREQYGVAAGDLWGLGAHRLWCGDATDPIGIRRLMTGERAMLCATDPPYGVDYTGLGHPSKYGAKEATKRAKNKTWSDKYIEWDRRDVTSLYQAFVACAMAEAVADHAAWYCWHGFRQQAILATAWLESGILLHQQIIWNKTMPVLGHSYYLNAHECCLFGWKKGYKPPRQAQDYPTTVWTLAQDRTPEAVLHPTPKPLEIWAIPMRQHTIPGDLCYEPFSGSGSQIIAAQQLGRRVYALEISPLFVAVALERFHRLTGQTPVRLT